MTMRFIIALFFSLNLFAFNDNKDVLVPLPDQGEISGKITDKNTNEPLPYVSVELFSESYQSHVFTDEMGLYTLKPIPTGIYSLKVSFAGYQELVFNDIHVGTDQILFINIPLESGFEIIYTDYKEPLIDPAKPINHVKFVAKDLKKMPTRNLNDVISLAAGAFYNEGGALQFRGSRAGTTQYIIDGVKMNELAGIPNSAIGEMEVFTGGIPAKYGDTTGGVVIINTKSFASFSAEQAQ